VSLLESTAHRLLNTLTDSLDEDLDRRPNHKKLRRTAYAAAGVALLTAASAGISSVRDRVESASDS
jgi:hypothetical protein